MRPNFILFEHRTKPEFTRRFNWRVGSLARASQPVNDYNGFRRVMHRVTLAGAGLTKRFGLRVDERGVVAMDC
jgi:hypothetical protein